MADQSGKWPDFWKTVDEDIPQKITNHPVTDLQPGVYRFRIFAVYVNNDNRNGKSRKFVLQEQPANILPPKVKPKNLRVLPLSPSALEIHWIYESDFDLLGFTIHFREVSSAGPYLMQVVEGANTRSHIITHLLPGTAYEVKMNAFNAGGSSNFSDIVSNMTLPSIISTTTESSPKVLIPIKPCRETNTTVYIVVGVTAFALVLVFVVCIAICVVRYKQKDNPSPVIHPKRSTKERHPKANSLHNLSHFSNVDYSNPYDSYKKSNGMNGHLTRSVLDGLPQRQSPNQAFVYQDSSESEKNGISIRLNPLSDDICVDIEGQSRTLTSTTFVGQSTRDLLRRSHHNLPNGTSDFSNNNIAGEAVQITTNTVERRRKIRDDLHPNAFIHVNHRSTSFTRLNGTLERKKRSRTDLVSYVEQSSSSSTTTKVGDSVVSTRCGSEASSTANGHAMMMQSSC